MLTNHFIDGQAIAKRLSRRLDRVIKAIEKLIKVYNAIDCPDDLLCQILQPTLPLSVQNEDVMNLSSQLWSTFDAMDHVASTQQLTVLQRKAIDLWNLKSRCEEEESNVQNDMQSSISHCNSEINTIDQVIQCLNVNDSPTSYDIGAASLLIRNRTCVELEFSHFDVQSVHDFIDTYLSDYSGTASDDSDCGSDCDIDL